MTDRETIHTAARALVDAAVTATRTLTRDGEAIDEHQVVVERIAYLATQARTLAELARVPASLAPAADVAAAEIAADLAHRLGPIAPTLGMPLPIYAAEVAAAIARGVAPAAVEALGVTAIADGGPPLWPHDELLGEVRSTTRAFADREVAPHAEHIHRHDELVPERFITEMAKQGYFGLSIPEAYGGHELGNLAMILTTEELSRASLAAAGSLITRPEILAKALLAGGTDAQRTHWLPRLASGETMAAISVTEPNVGSDVAAVACRAERDTDGDGWSITGAKAWCTFAGRADVIALLARTGAASDGARGLTLFVVEKPRFDGHEFTATQPGGGTLAGKADRTPGYRGMHSFTLAFDRWRVPASALVGGEAGLGRGFVLQMAGFVAGRLQTGGRACGVTLAAIEHTARYVADRRQFGHPIGDFGLTRYHMGRMVSRLVAARAITYAAASAMDAGEVPGAPTMAAHESAATLAAMSKLFACDIAVEVTQLGQLLHGGWGYAEEYPISRCVADAQVLPIFEGVKPILALKVIGRAVLGRTR